MTRRPLPLLLLCVLVLGACGGDEPAPTRVGGLDPDDPALNGSRDTEPPAPSPAPARPVPERVRAQLRAGEIALFDLTGATVVRPRTVDVSRTETIEGIRWTRWDRAGAVGTGRMVTNTCDPSCAVGAKVRQRATLSLFGPRTCDGRRYWGRSSVRATRPGYEVVSYLTAPC